MDRRKRGELMARFDFTSEHVSIFDDADHRLDLNPQEALELLRWLFDRRDALYDLAHLGTVGGQASERLLEIHLYQEHLEYLDRLKAAIPALHEHKPAVILGIPLDLVTERAITLLKELQLEYKIHPLLEEDDAFAQG
ncbi:MAG TPA: hypothetical protein VKB35_10365 [Ktedonobacteraceae bacterium]|nr:hypothetical protein [Ktedonobacteraceae bacterium]